MVGITTDTVNQKAQRKREAGKREQSQVSPVGLHRTLRAYEKRFSDLWSLHSCRVEDYATLNLTYEYKMLGVVPNKNTLDQVYFLLVVSRTWFTHLSTQTTVRL